jgi:L-alanine-DL-glutamate epimerase-like enolase superfamily enzyme
VNLHLCAAITSGRSFGILRSAEPFAFGLQAPLPIAHGIARLPEAPGLGCAVDFDAIDDATTEFV